MTTYEESTMHRTIRVFVLDSWSALVDKPAAYPTAGHSATVLIS